MILDIIFTVNTILVKTTHNHNSTQTNIQIFLSKVSIFLPHIASLGDGSGARDVHDVGLDDDVEDPHGPLHGLRVELAHVGPGVLQLGLGDVQHPLPPGVVVRDGDPVVVSDHVGSYRLDGLAVGLDPAHSVSLATERLFHQTVLSLFRLTWISLTTQTKVASWPISTVMFFMPSTNLGFIPAPTGDKKVKLVLSHYLSRDVNSPGNMKDIAKIVSRSR